MTDALLVLAPLAVAVAIFVPLMWWQLSRQRMLAGRDALDGLAAPDRDEVRRAVRGGRQVESPALTGPATRWAEYTIAAQEQQIQRQRKLRWVIAGAGVVIAVCWATTLGNGLGVLFGVLMTASAFVPPVGPRRAIRQARAAHDANRAPGE